jgi:hypothetical protein
MEHYVVVHEWSCDYENGSTVLGVGHSLEEAKVIFNNNIDEEKEYAKENGYEIYDDTDVVFDAGEEGYYSRSHTMMYIQGV